MHTHFCSGPVYPAGQVMSPVPLICKETVIEPGYTVSSSTWRRLSTLGRNAWQWQTISAGRLVFAHQTPVAFTAENGRKVSDRIRVVCQHFSEAELAGF